MNPQPPNLSSGTPSSYPSHSPPDVYQQGHSAAATAAAALSQQDTPAQNANGRKRKASGQPGSRGVANLTPEQLAKKRANDREAQRAIRERTKNTIDTLANRIKELESQQPFQELQKVVQERDRALQECEDLKRKLQTVASVVNVPQQAQQGQPQQQPNLHEGDAELAALTAQQSPLPSLNTIQGPPQYPHHSATGQPYEQQNLDPDLRSPHSAAHSSPEHQSSAVGSSYQSDATSLRKWSPSLEHSSNAQYPPANGLSYDQRLPQPPQVQTQSNGERLGLAYVLEPQQRPSRTSPTSQASAPYISEKPMHLRQTHNSAPTCPLDALLLDFLANRRQQIEAGVPVHEVAGPEYPFLRALQDPDAPQSHNCHPVSALLIDILSKFPDMSMLPEKVAVLYNMFLLLRWQICPCKACYYSMPEWMRPTREQVDMQHAAWIDHVPWPIIRRNLIATYAGGRVKFEEFFIPFTSKLSVNWPYPHDQVLISNPADAANPVIMNPVFETHLRDLKNWSMGSIFANEFPFLVDDSVSIKNVPPGQPS
ncbi:hypothetical protein LTR37_011760 [Vermiconidia calcicola]|uniref:Uncharacterized protein n=1 Tax=Vermiconidia calcicola TaxID=1690605 RepID=A0ACC3N2D1_9PEZI|nr:hypothetical protein LTR37_011760 [Vermiconidia calcicola]